MADELLRLSMDLRGAAESVVPKAQAAVAKTARDVEGDAKAIVPVDTGFLKNSISTDVGQLEAEIGPTAHYGHYVEYGTSRMAPQPYMGPAFDRRAPGLEQALRQIGGEILSGR